MNSTVRVILITVISFLAYYFLDHLYFKTVRSFFIDLLGNKGIGHNITYLISGIPLYIGLIVLHGYGNVLSSVGLHRSITRGMVLALLCTLPMFIGYAMFFPLNTELTWTKILISGVAAAFFEELFFRGFLFGQLYRFTRLGFIPAIIFGAVLFGAVHLYQSDDPMTMVGVFLTTFLGALLFGWVYVEWKFNLWVAIFLHFFMNFAWMLFSVDDTALGGTYANIFRYTTVACIIVGTILYKRRKEIPLEVTRKTLWVKKNLN